MAGGLAGAARRARPGKRLAGFLAVYLLLAAAIGWRLVAVQVVGAEEYRDMAERQTQRQVALPPRRGAIRDREGDPLAVSVPAAAVYGNPRALRAAGLAPDEVAADLAEILDVPAGDLADRLGEDSGFVYLARQVPRAVGQQVRELRVPSIGVLDEPERAYPVGELAAQVVGFSGLDGEGLSGLEIAHDDLLTGRPGLLRQERAPGGVEISSAPREVIPATPGDDLVLALDARIQHTAERLLADAVAEHDAKGASAVVLDVASGEVLAMASSPGYDPAAIADANAYQRRNRVVTDAFEPGSVLKAVTLAAVVEEGLASPDDEMRVPTGVKVGGKRFTDSTPQPKRTLTLEQVMAESSNVGTIMLARDLGPETLHEYLLRFGFGKPTGLRFPGESTGALAEPSAWSATSLPTIAIGQGVSASLLQVAGAYATIARGGEHVEPRLVREIVRADGTVDPLADPRRERVVSERTAADVSGMLASVVADGTGTAAAINGYEVAGKTGTAQKASETARGYEPGAYIASFAGFAPAEDPELVIAVMVDEPEESYYGGVVAAPVFAELMEFALSDRRVAPSRGRSDRGAGGEREDEGAADTGSPASGQDDT